MSEDTLPSDSIEAVIGRLFQMYQRKNFSSVPDGP